MNKERKFPEGFLWGGAVAANQYEGRMNGLKRINY